MSYATQSKLARDTQILQRVAACAATQAVVNPEQWAWDRAWELSSRSGWDAAYAAAIAKGIEEPGTDETVVTDSMILAAVKAMINPPSA